MLDTNLNKMNCFLNIKQFKISRLENMKNLILYLPILEQKNSVKIMFKSFLQN